MVPNKFNIVEFGGFDLAGQYGEALPGIYDKIVDAHWNCVYIMCFGLKFAGFDIAPQYMIPEMFSDHIMLNGIISIDQNDVITIHGIEPEPPEPPEPVILPLSVDENGIYTAPEGVDGFAPVTVDVSSGAQFVVDTYSPLLSSVFDTGAPIDSGNTIEVSFYAESYVNDGHIVGQSYSSAGSNFHLTTYNNKWFYGGISEGSFVADSDCPLYGADIVYKAKTGEISMNGVVKSTNFTMPNRPTYTYKLNTRGGSISTTGVYKYKYVRVYDSNDELVCNWEFGHLQIGSAILYAAHEKVHDTYYFFN